MSKGIKIIHKSGMCAVLHYDKKLPLVIKIKNYSSGEKYLYFLHPIVYHLSKVHLRAINAIDYNPILKRLIFGLFYFHPTTQIHNKVKLSLCFN
jgi:hypothetical protein